MEYIYYYDSPLGGITLASDGKVLTGLWFNGQKYFANTLSKDYVKKIYLFLNRHINGLISISAVNNQILFHY